MPCRDRSDESDGHDASGDECLKSHGNEQHSSAVHSIRDDATKEGHEDRRNGVGQAQCTNVERAARQVVDGPKQHQLNDLLGADEGDEAEPKRSEIWVLHRADRLPAPWGSHDGRSLHYGFALTVEPDRGGPGADPQGRVT